MDEQSDAQLLRDYARRGDEAAFREIVARHTDFVYSAALRQVHSPDLACDITQGVFIDLARKARAVSKKITDDRPLLGWLHRGARYAALTHLRDDRRRLAREREAMEQLLANNEPAPDWELIRPLLDEALEALTDDDREALFLRYFKNQDLRAVGLALGVSDDTAQKRASRAVERLREFLSQRGLAVGAAGLATALSANAVQAAPAGLAAVISTAAVLAGTAIAATSTVTAAKIITMTTLQKSVLAAALTATLATGIRQAGAAAQLRGQTQKLEERTSSLAGQLDKLNRERDDDTRELARARNENERLRRNAAELQELRAEAAAARAASRRDTAQGPKADDPEAKLARTLIDRVKLLRQRLDQWPGKKAPELRLLDEQDWLNEALKGGLETEEAQRKAMSELRYKANEAFADAVQPALFRFTAANSGRLPSDLSQLAMYLAPPLGAILDDFEIAAPSAVPPNFSPNGVDMEKVGAWGLVEKGSAAAGNSFEALPDPKYDKFIVIYKGGHYYRAP